MSALNYVIGNRAPNGAVAHKCDVFSAIGSNIDASIGASSQLVSDIFNWWNVNRTNDLNERMARETNRISVQQAEANRLFQAKMNRENNAFAADQARIQREWDSAQQQIARLRAAGLNPAVLFGQGSGSAAAGSASLASPHGSGVTPSMPTLTAPHFEAFQMASPVAAFKDMAQAFAELSQSDKTSAEAEMLKKGMADSLRTLKANADSAEIGRDLELLFAGQERNLKIQREKVEIAKSTQQAFNLAKEGNFIEARTVLTRQQEKSEKALTTLRGEQARVAKNDADTYFRTLETRLKNIASSTAYNYQAAENQRQQAENTQLENVRQNWLNAILQTENIYDHDRFRDLMLAQYESAYQHGQLTKQEFEKLRQTLPHLVQQAENAAKIGTPWSAEYFVDAALKAISISAGASAKLMFK